MAALTCTLMRARRPPFTMSSHDTEVSVYSASLGTSAEEGQIPFIELSIIQGLALPIPNPQTGEPIVFPAGQYRFKFARTEAIALFKAALEAAEGLPDTFSPSGKVLVAHDMTQVEQTHRNIKRATGQ